MRNPMIRVYGGGGSTSSKKRMMVIKVLRDYYIYSLPMQCNSLIFELRNAIPTKLMYNLLTRQCVRSGQHIFSWFFIYTSFNENKAGGME